MNTDKNIPIINALKINISKVIIGKEDVTDLILTALIAEGHVLLEDVPGTGKTVLAKSLAKSIQAGFSRIQFTPDLLPSDVTGLNYFDQKISDFTFRKGPVFTNILLADEINRATPRTQSALLECMEERQVTIDGESRLLEQPFFVIATQNPIETAGTFPLPEAQLDRFLMRLSMGIPTRDEELSIMDRFLTADPISNLSSVCTASDITALQKAYKHIYIHPDLRSYIADLITATRRSENVSMGVSPRGTLALLRAARAYAMVKGRTYVIPEDIKHLAVPVLAHRIIFPAGSSTRSHAEQFLLQVLNSVPVPTEEWRP